MEAVLHARRARVRALVLLTTIVTGILALLTPSGAEARVFVYSKDGNGLWAEPANWTWGGDGGSPGVGYPVEPGDIAIFSANYTADFTVQLPSSGVAVGEIYFIGDKGIRIDGSSALTFDNKGSAATLTAYGNLGNVQHEISAPMRLNGPLTITLNPSTSLRTYEIDEAGGPRSLTKRGAGTLVRARAGTYTGPTIVEDGRLLVNVLQATTPTLRGNLTVGDGVGASASAYVSVTPGGQIINTADITVMADGKLELLDPEQVDEVTVNGGQVFSRGSSRFTMKRLTMNGGLLFSVQNGGFTLEGPFTATSVAAGPAVLQRDQSSNGTFNLAGDVRRFVVNDGPGAIELDIQIPLSGTGSSGVQKEGIGTMRFSGPYSNTYTGATIVREGRLDLARANGGIAIPGTLLIGGPTTAAVGLVARENIADTSKVTVTNGGGLILTESETFELIAIENGGRLSIDDNPLIQVQDVLMSAGRIVLTNGSLTIAKDLNVTSVGTTPATIEGSGNVTFVGDASTIITRNGPADVDLSIYSTIYVKSGGLIKRGPGVAYISGTVDAKPVKMLTGVVAQASPIAQAPLLDPMPLNPTRVFEGTLYLSGKHDGEATVPGGADAGARLGGNGSLGAISAEGGIVAPGIGPGKLTVNGPVKLTASTTLDVDILGSSPGSNYDQLDVRGTVTLGGAALTGTLGFTPTRESTFVVIINDGTDPVSGTFANLPEGATARIGGTPFTISYRGGDGNDVVLTEAIKLTYFLAEGATGEFFDDDVLIANANTEPVPVTLTFMKEGGSTIVDRRTIPAQSRITVHVDQIPGLEDASASVQVVSENRLPLVVERSMFWDENYYGGHTANAVAQPETHWIFAEGFQGYFDTYILIANANDTPATATLTFLRENDTPIVQTVEVGAFTRKTVWAGGYDELKDRAFGIVVDATLPVIAERSMYFATVGDRLWSGGHVNTGITAPSKTWFHAEGATGGYFNTFILLSNPQDTEAHVDLTFLLDTGAVITRSRTIAAKQRVTVNPATEGDTRLENAAVSTVVTSDVPIVSERSMYWEGEAAKAFGEGHNSSGVDATRLLWGLAEGRLGGPHNFDTYILLANPSASEAKVTVTYLREGGMPIVKEYTVPATSRFNIDVKTVVPELRNASFGARVEVTNNVPIAVERSMYWDVTGVSWAGGSNALATPLPPPNATIGQTRGR